MVNLDLAISVGIWVSGVGMSAIGIEMTIRPPTDQHANRKWVYRWLFIGLGIAFIGLGAWQFDRNDQKEQTQQHENTQEQIRNEGNIKYMQGQLDSINKVLASLSSNSNSNQTAAILKSLIVGMPQALAPGQTALEKMSNKQLRLQVLGFVPRLHKLAATYKQRETDSSNQERAETAKLGPADRQGLQDSSQRMGQRDLALFDQFRADYEALFAADALSYRDELIRRLGPQQPTGIRIPLSVDGWISPTSVDATATYLEMLAKKFPEQE